MSSKTTIIAGSGSTAAGLDKSRPLMRAAGIAKSFSGNPVLQSVDLDLYPGEVVGLLGENGAGKSTLMHILSGGLQPDSGSLRMNNTPVTFKSVAEGIAAGISFVHQELSVVAALSVAENLFLGRLPRSKLGFVDFGAIASASAGILERVGAGRIDPAAEAGSLRAGEQQLVEIAKAAARNPRLLILDEPTSSLTPHEVDGFVRYLNAAREAGTAIVFITHRLEEALAFCDRIVVLRNGAIVSERTPEETSREQIIADMTGKPALYAHRPRQVSRDEIALSLQSVSDGRHIDAISLDIFKGEIFGLFGLVGAGRTELLELIHGARRLKSGSIRLFGENVEFAGSHRAVQSGVALVPEGRKTAGILPSLSVRSNASVSHLDALARVGFVNRRKEAALSAEYGASLGIRMASDLQPVATLSGGNQQKVIFARALMSGPRLLLLDEPTHGVDVGAKGDLYQIIVEQAEKGLTAVIASSEVPEIMALCDRVAVLSKGKLAGILDRDEMTEDSILTLAFKDH